MRLLTASPSIRVLISRIGTRIAQDPFIPECSRAGGVGPVKALRSMVLRCRPQSRVVLCRISESLF